MIIAIDGPAGSGKSTIARELSRRLGFEKLDTGAMYRAVAFTALDRGIDLVDDRDVSREIRTPLVDANVSKVSAYPGVRTAMLEPQRAVAQNHDVVAEGRDIGTVVFPDAEVKVFLTADPRVRAQRRVLQRHGGDVTDARALESEVAETLASIERRDALDASRDVAPLVAAPDAVQIDSTAFTIDEVTDQIADLVAQKRGA